MNALILPDGAATARQRKISRVDTAERSVHFQSSLIIRSWTAGLIRRGPSALPAGRALPPAWIEAAKTNIRSVKLHARINIIWQLGCRLRSPVFETARPPPETSQCLPQSPSDRPALSD
jgi:hypothetical protein